VRFDENKQIFIIVTMTVTKFKIPTTWNSLAESLRSEDSIAASKSQLKNHYFNIWRVPWKNRIYWYISFFRPSLNRVFPIVLFTGGRGVSDFSVLKYY